MELDLGSPPLGPGPAREGRRQPASSPSSRQAVDDVLARSVDRYARARERTLVALDRVSSAALGSGDLEKFLPRLLEVLLETTATADSAYLMLRDDSSEVYRIRAEAGANADRSLGFTARIGETPGEPRSWLGCRWT